MARKKITFIKMPELPFDWGEDEIKVIEPPRSSYSRAAIVQPKEERDNDPSSRFLYYFSMGSGSSGNSCYVGTKRGGMIIDAVIRADNIESFIKQQGIDIKNVRGILLTHDHSDHVKYVYTLLRNHRHLRVFCTNRVLNGLLRRHNISKRIKDYHVPIFKEIPFKVGDFEITAFEVPHDGSDNMGFSINFDERKFVLATDMGAVSARARHYISSANYLVVESNYDLQMLLTGRYPDYLKARIQTEFGHMDNLQTAALLEEIAHPGLSHVFLCHLSQDNNTAEKALQASRNALERIGLKVGNARETIEDRNSDIQLMVLPRHEATRLFVFRPLNHNPN